MNPSVDRLAVDVAAHALQVEAAVHRVQLGVAGDVVEMQPSVVGLEAQPCVARDLQPVARVPAVATARARAGRFHRSRGLDPYLAGQVPGLGFAVARGHDPDAAAPAHRGEELSALLLACLEKDPGRRPSFAGAFLAALDELSDVPPWTNDEARAWWGARGAQIVARVRANAKGAGIPGRRPADSSAGTLSFVRRADVGPGA